MEIIILFRFKQDVPEVLLVHPGGPFWKNKDLGAWSIPKGEFEETEDPLKAAKREFKEETGLLPHGPLIELTPVKLNSGKLVYAWAIKQDADASKITNNTFELEWPPKSGNWKQFPEIDKALWFDLNLEKGTSSKGQLSLLLAFENLPDEYN